MNLDKSWTKITNKVDPKFIRGAIAFAKWAERYADTEGQIHCPCRNCVNARRDVPNVVADHIIQYGFEPTYNVWIYHGEHLPGYETDTHETNSEFEESDNESNDGVGELLDDAFPTGGNTEAENFRDGADQRNNPNVEKLFIDMMKPLYPGCDEFSVLGFLLELMNVKVTCKMTNVSMDMILNLFSRAFKDANLSKNHYEAKKYLRTLGLGYESIHACKHDCALFLKENANLQTCPVCSTSRYEENSKGRKKPVKVLRYFPITSRLKRLYASRHTAKEMLWHDQYRTKEEGVLRHPADGKAWEHFDTTFPDFANDPRNVRLGLASDGLILSVQRVFPIVCGLLCLYHTICLLGSLWSMLHLC
ncbi:putative Transposase-associated domain-containing protein [Helianthus annuus]|nr:putative Transposase-associated domain-containing protein [Helianthus annuus]